MPDDIDLDQAFRDAVRHWDAGRLQDAEPLLRRAAERGHVAAMARLGRLHCLDPHGDAEGWLRRAVAAGPDDPDAATLLASLLIRWANQQIEEFHGSDLELHEFYRWPDRLDEAVWRDEDFWGDLDDAAFARRIVDAHDEAERLLARPGDPAAALTMAGLWDGRATAHRIIAGSDGEDAAAVAARMGAALAKGPAPGRPEPYSWYEVERRFVCTNNGDLGVQLLCTADPGELRWAGARWAAGWRPTDRPMDPARGEALTLVVHDGAVAVVDLTGLVTGLVTAPIDWSAVEVPALRGRPLPPAVPAASRSLPGPLFYGFTESLGR